MSREAAVTRVQACWRGVLVRAGRRGGPPRAAAGASPPLGSEEEVRAAVRIQARWRCALEFHVYGNGLDLTRLQCRARYGLEWRSVWRLSIDYDEISDDPYVMLQTALDNEEEARDILGGSW